MHRKFEINPTKIKGGCQVGREVVTHNSKSDLPIVYILCTEPGPYVNSHTHTRDLMTNFNTQFFFQGQKQNKTMTKRCIIVGRGQKVSFEYFLSLLHAYYIVPLNTYTNMYVKCTYMH